MDVQFKPIITKISSLKELKEAERPVPKPGTIGYYLRPQPPKDLKEFEERLGELYCDLKNQFFGLTFDVETGITLKRKKSPERLVHAILVHEKYLQKHQSLPSEKSETYPFLKLALENNAHLFGQDYYILGVHRDRSDLSDPQKNAIAVQSAAQALWQLEGSKIPTIEAMVDRLLNRQYAFYELLKLSRFHDPRTIKKWVRPIFPLPQGERKKRRTKNISAFHEMVSIPGIFTESGISFPRLRFALICITRIFKALVWPQSQIVESRPIKSLMDPLKFYPRDYANDWIEEAYSTNGSLFES